MNYTKQEVLLKLLISLNEGNCGYIDSRINLAENQIEQLKEAGYKFKEDEIV